MTRWLRRVRVYWSAIIETAPSALAGIAIVVVAAITVLLAGLVLAVLTTLLY